MANPLSREHSSFFYIFLIILQGLIFGIGNPIVKFAYETITPIWCLAIRFTAATLIFIIPFGKKAIQELRATKMHFWFPTAICMAAAYITSNVGLNLTTATSVGFLMSLPIVFTPFLSKLILKRKIHKAFLPVPLIAIAGLYLISLNGGSFHFGLGEGLSLCCSIAMAGALVWGEEGLNHLSATTISLVQLLVTAIASTVCALCLEPMLNLSAIAPKAWLVILYLVIFCSCLCYIFQNIALSHISSAVVALTQCGEPLFTAAASFFILGERLSPLGFFGAALLILCIIYGNYIENKTQVPQP